MPILLKRVYEPAEPADGYRVLVDRLWPRGVSKARAAIDLWAKDVAPTPALREWFNHEPERFAEFRVRYRAELEHNGAVDDLHAVIGEHPETTLVYAAHDEAHNHAIVLADYLRELPPAV
ncbi:DUF488 domain-containing protein [Diaminobutyricibacter tongyongensis]|uniref:DUF488 domain-containing protein n=1 Tax=Leifsonia tongyongensis TaxID=1268043 RepID=A0A6L9XT87_9MICO|nr:DUF488 domain-containing protein [Diaminobutyricibacter tongyongensis]NEN04593.1 DUF488 domain-containing protein [Diaminobutyricibacter tongyongensis]